MSPKFPIWLLGLLLVLTATLTTQYFQYAMMGLTVFVLAYLTKGMRKHNKKYQ
ncbi:hypothetical protein cce_4292 [Crocosphaera subtropica ATCC 51142]|uniref:Uncharacterized protein n=1 Tax=Crocosphaera subtropica (strain ATCC 51142 / BH68) TaxID=43989 RepID=B1WSR1_CROS5|nr:hypothetical protein [Crocosphaera subtropica]ACB53640.1 hypothetical protein cce_4292 [Crocosphaera subtropica ATCC 51142]